MFVTKDRIVQEVQTDVQASAFISSGWKVVESVKKADSVVSTPVVNADDAPKAEPVERKRPGRKTKEA